MMINTVHYIIGFAKYNYVSEISGRGARVEDACVFNIFGTEFQGSISYFKKDSLKARPCTNLIL